ncbi:MAG TPA: hypothetical protein VK807_08810 [Gemmatimonadaceae bacterium]|jgi:hypothetical protein|nr:hypothetical protein [Gemmatimonadaceae bacterium]
MQTKVGLFAMLLLSSSLAAAQMPDSNWAGTWTLNIASSVLVPTIPKSEVVVIPAPGWSAHSVKYTISSTAGDGSSFNVSFDGAADGKPYPVMSDGKETAQSVWHRRSSRHYTATFTYPQGTTVAFEIVMAPDGKRYTYRTHVTTSTGHTHITAPTSTYDETAVFDKE